MRVIVRYSLILKVVGAAQIMLAGHMRPAKYQFETPALNLNTFV